MKCWTATVPVTVIFLAENKAAAREKAEEFLREEVKSNGILGGASLELHECALNELPLNGWTGDGLVYGADADADMTVREACRITGGK